MTNSIRIFSILFIAIVASLTSCSSDNECDNSCPTGTVQLLDCTCATDASTIVPDPCLGTAACAAGQIKAYPGCNCVDLMEPLCNGKTCPAGELLNTSTCDCEVVNTGTVDVMGVLTEDQIWTKNNVYVLRERVTVPDGITLTIEAGTIIKGAGGVGTRATAMVIARGARLMAMGTAEEPIIFTTINDNIQPGQCSGSNLTEEDNGEWGGLLILGRAPISADGDATEAQIEGIPPSDINGLYGGDDPEDNSGVIQYVSVRHGGADIGQDNEINGITLGGVGSGTIIENIEVVGNKDDGIEWFGGTVNVTNAVVWAADDDALDIDQSYSGTITNAVVVAFPGTDHCLEIDGPEGSLPGSFTIQNASIKGSTQELGNMRDGALGALNNIYFTDFSSDPDADENGDGEADGEGDFTFSGDNTDASYAAGTLTFSGFEITPGIKADGSVISTDRIFKDFNEADLNAVGIVARGMQTGGADLSVFGWTYTSCAGQLDF